MKDVQKICFIKEYFGVHMPKHFPQKAYEALSKYFPDLTLNEVRKAAKLVMTNRISTEKR